MKRCQAFDEVDVFRTLTQGEWRLNRKEMPSGVRLLGNGRSNKRRTSKRS